MYYRGAKVRRRRPPTIAHASAALSASPNTAPLRPQAAIVVYDVTSKPSFDRAKSWVTELQQSGSVSMVIALAGNKADLESQREVPQDEAQQYASDNGLLFLETSAKSNMNVTEIFSQIAKHLPRAGPKAADGAAATINVSPDNQRGDSGCAC